jgi:type I restriction enzyme M protein
MTASIVHHALSASPRSPADLADFVEVYKAGDRSKRVESDRFHLFTYDEFVGRNKGSLDLFWLRDESLEDNDNLPPPEVLAAESVEDLEAALAEFSKIAALLAAITDGGESGGMS